MSWSIKLFKIRGIDIKVHLTFVLILVWAAYRWGVSTGKGMEGALFGVAVTLLLFLCVTLHELGHSFQALRFGVPVKDITLWPFGGLAQIERMPEKPSQELLIAIAGPLVNLLIGFGLLLLSQVLQLQGWLAIDQLFQLLGDVSWQGLLAYLIMANFALAIFNLIPAFPMDGGRVLRARVNDLSPCGALIEGALGAGVGGVGHHPEDPGSAGPPSMMPARRSHAARARSPWSASP